MPSAVEVSGVVVAQAALPEGRHLLTLSAPAAARTAAAGQFAMLRAADGWDPYLRRALPFLRVAGDDVSFLFGPSEPGLAWLARRRLGEPVGLIGPLGHGFELQPTTRHLLLIALGEAMAPLLALATHALAAQISVSLVMGATFVQSLGSIIPEAVELIAAPDASAALSQAAGLLSWADQAAAAGAAEDLKRLLHVGPVIRAGLVQCYVQAGMVCGLGWCGACLTELRRGPRRACTGGPVFDLTELA